MVVARPATAEPLRLRKLWLTDDRGKPEQGPEAFRGVLLVAGHGNGNGDAPRTNDVDATNGFEDVPANHAVLVSRDLKFVLADLTL
jgi:hypothetical protein